MHYSLQYGSRTDYLVLYIHKQDKQEQSIYKQIGNNVARFAESEHSKYRKAEENHVTFPHKGIPFRIFAICKIFIYNRLQLVAIMLHRFEGYVAVIVLVCMIVVNIVYHREVQPRNCILYD